MNDDTDPIDPMPGVMAALDQVLALASEMARITRGLFDAYKAEGFSDQQAAYFTVCQIQQGAGPPP